MSDEILSLTHDETPSSDDVIALALEVDERATHCVDACNRVVFEFRTPTLAKRFIAVFGERFSFGGDIDIIQDHARREVVYAVHLDHYVLGRVDKNPTYECPW